MTLDMPYQTHPLKHENHTEYKECKNMDANVYVDDIFGILESEKEDIWDKIEFFINKMSTYLKNNLLVINIDKTGVMLITEDKELLKSERIIENQILKTS